MATDPLNPNAVDAALDANPGKPQPVVDAVTIPAAELVRLRAIAASQADTEAASARYVATDSLSRAIAARTDLAEGASELLALALGPALKAKQVNGQWVVATDDGRSAADHLADYLNQPKSRLFLKAGARPGPDLGHPGRSLASMPGRPGDPSPYLLAVAERMKQQQQQGLGRGLPANRPKN